MFITFKKWTTKMSSYDPFKKTKAVTPLHKLLEVLSNCSNYKLKWGPFEIFCSFQLSFWREGVDNQSKKTCKTLDHEQWGMKSKQFLWLVVSCFLFDFNQSQQPRLSPVQPLQLCKQMPHPERNKVWWRRNPFVQSTFFGAMMKPRAARKFWRWCIIFWQRTHSYEKLIIKHLCWFHHHHIFLLIINSSFKLNKNNCAPLSFCTLSSVGSPSDLSQTCIPLTLVRVQCTLPCKFQSSAFLAIFKNSFCNACSPIHIFFFYLFNR